MKDPPAMSERDLNSGSNTADLLKLAGQIISAYVSNNTISTNELPDMIRVVHNTLSDLESGTDPINHNLTPAVPIKKSITPDFIICLEDGKKTENAETLFTFAIRHVA
jgi:predicted transcriptional regulator